MPNIRQACFFSAFKRVVKLPLLLLKNFDKVLCVDRLVQSGTLPSQTERGEFYALLLFPNEERGREVLEPKAIFHNCYTSYNYIINALRFFGI